jgi:hypothetical protein
MNGIRPGLKSGCYNKDDDDNDDIFIWNFEQFHYTIQRAASYTVTGTVCVCMGYRGSHSVPHLQHNNVKSQQWQCASYLTCTIPPFNQYVAQFSKNLHTKYVNMCTIITAYLCMKSILTNNNLHM